MPNEKEFFQKASYMYFIRNNIFYEEIQNATGIVKNNMPRL